MTKDNREGYHAACTDIRDAVSAKRVEMVSAEQGASVSTACKIFDAVLLEIAKITCAKIAEKL